MAKKTSNTSKKKTARKARPTRKKRTVAAKGSTRGGTSTRRKASTTKKATTRKPSSKTTTPRKRSTTKKKQAPAGPIFTAPQKALFIGVLLIAITAILILSLLSPTQGSVTASLFNGLKSLFGLGGWLVPLVMGGIGFYLVLWGIGQPPRLKVSRLVGLGILFVTFEALSTLWVFASNNGFNDVWQIGRAKLGGGYFGAALTWATIKAVGELGSAFLFLLASLFGVILVSGLSRLELGNWARQIASSGEEKVAQQRNKIAKPTKEEAANHEIPGNPAAINRPTAAVIRERPSRILDIEPEPAEEIDRMEEIRQRRRDQAASVEVKKPAKQSKKKKSELPVAEPTSPVSSVMAGSKNKGDWVLPEVSKMLNLGAATEVEDVSIREQVEIIEHTLESFGAPVKTVEINTGPTVTQFGVEPLYLESRSGRRTKVKVSKIAGLADDLALALAAKSVRVQAPVPGKGYIGIEVPNNAKVTVSLRDVIESTSFAQIKSPLRIGLGQDVAGNPVSADLAKMPHLLIAGATGSGKSVAVNGIIACLLLQNTPEDLRFVMVDPKRVELTGYNGIPHLAAPVVVEVDRVVGVLQWALREMDSRYQMFATIGSRNIISYNKKAESQGKDSLPYIVIIIDELADLMMTAPEDTERALARLAQMARATGIHMIIATQRPSVDVVTGLIKANFPARMAFAVSSSIDSRVVLDTTGAERLLGAGDMLFQKPDSPSPMRMQGCWVSDEELADIINYWKKARRNFKYTAADAQPRDALLGVKPGQPAIIVPPEEANEPAKTVTARQQPAEPIQPDNEVVKRVQQATIRESSSGSRPSRNRPKTQPIVEQPIEVEKPVMRAVRPAPAEPVFDEIRDDFGKEIVSAEPPTIQQSPPIQEPPPLPQLTPEPEPELEAEGQQPLWEDLIDMKKIKSEQVDDLWDDAVAFVQKAGKASTSMLQRRFRIGYTRAARIIDEMEDSGVIGPPTGTSKAREVLMSGEAD